MPVIIGGNKEQQKKYLGRLIDEPLVAVSLLKFYFYVPKFMNTKNEELNVFKWL